MSWYCSRFRWLTLSLRRLISLWYNAWCLLHADFSLCLLFDPEAGGNMFLRNMDFHQTVRHYTPKDRILHKHSCENLRSCIIIFILTDSSILFYPILLCLLSRRQAYEIMILCECYVLILNQFTDFHELRCGRCNTGETPNFTFINVLPRITKWHTNLFKWEGHYRFMIQDIAIMYGNRAFKNIQLQSNL